MTLVRRLAALETSLTPTQLVLRWLDETHAFGDLESYVRSQLAEPSAEGPLDRLAREAASGVRVSLRGKRPEIVDAAVRTALRETVFRFDLVMRILVTTHDLLEREGLIEAALSAHLALLTTEGRAERRRDATYRERFATLRGLLAAGSPSCELQRKPGRPWRRAISPATPLSSPMPWRPGTSRSGAPRPSPASPAAWPRSTVSHRRSPQIPRPFQLVSPSSWPTSSSRP